MSMYIRVKHKKATIFLQVEPTDTVLEVKQKLQTLISMPPEQLQLRKDEVVLEDAKKLADLHIENDDVVAMCYALAGGGGFEAVDITPVDAPPEVEGGDGARVQPEAA